MSRLIKWPLQQVHSFPLEMAQQASLYGDCILKQIKANVLIKYALYLFCVFKVKRDD